MALDGTHAGAPEPTLCCYGGGLEHDCSTWDELYEEDDGEKPNVKNNWNGPSSSSTAQPMASTADSIVQVTNALKPGAEIVRRMNAKGTK